MTRIRVPVRAAAVFLAVAATALAGPAVASASPGRSATPAASDQTHTVAAAVAELGRLRLTPLTHFPSGRVVSPTAGSDTNFGYRTYDDYNAEMQALADRNRGLVEIRTAPHRSIEGRAVKYLEITNNVSARDGKPVFFLMGLIHGNEWPGAEDALEFAYDVVQQARTNPRVHALLDHVRLIDLPVVNPDGLVHFRRHNCDGAVAPATCPTSSDLGVDMNRNYPYGWGSNTDVDFSDRGAGPGSEPEVQNTMAIVEQHQAVVLVSNHTNEHAIFYPPLDIAAGDTPDLNDGYQALAKALAGATANGYTNVRDSAHDYETSGETIDWSYYATRGLAFTFEVVGAADDCNVRNSTSKSASAPNYANCTVPDYTGTPGPTSTPGETTAFGGHPLRNAYYLALAYASIGGGHSTLEGIAPPGATLTAEKHFDLYTAPIKQDTTPPSTSPPEAVPTELRTTTVVPRSGFFQWNVNPSVRPTPAFRADGEHTGPNGFLRETWTLTCQPPHGTAHRLSVTADKGQRVWLPPCQLWPRAR